MNGTPILLFKSTQASFMNFRGLVGFDRLGCQDTPGIVTIFIGTCLRVYKRHGGCKYNKK